MEDILITAAPKNEISVSPQTENAKKIFKKQGVAEGMLGPKAAIGKILAWAVSHNLSTKSEVEIVIPSLGAPYEQLYPTNSSDWKELSKNSDLNFQHLEKIDEFSKSKKELLYRYFHVPVADGRAYYQIVNVLKTKVTVARCTGICPDEYSDMILGQRASISKVQAQEFVAGKDALKKLFSKK